MWHAFLAIHFMPTAILKRRLRHWLLYGSLLLVFIFGFLAVVAERFVAPMLKERIHTLIVQGSDSLYTYQMGKMDASFFGGSVELSDFQMKVDSNRYRQLLLQHKLPSVTMEVNMGHGHLRSVGIISLVFGKKVSIGEIFSRDAHIILTRHTGERDSLKEEAIEKQPLWKSIQPLIRSIKIGNITLDGLKLLYKSEDSSQSVKLQFDTCNAVFKNIMIDSAAARDTDRIGFAKEISLHFYDLKFRSSDSTYKLKAKVIDYSSKDRSLSIEDFKLQPTLKDKESFYAATPMQKTMTTIEYKKLSFTNFQLDQFFHNNAIVADSLVIDQPVVSLYLDKTKPPVLDSKMGKYPHQLLLSMGSDVNIKGIAVRNLGLTYTERGEKTAVEGTLNLTDVNIQVSNITNIPSNIRQNGKCIANMHGKILGSPMAVKFTFYLDSTDGRFDAEGSIENVTAAQLNGLAEPLANTKLQSFNMHKLDFFVSGDDFTATANVNMKYDNLFLVLQKRDENTGATITKKFLTKLINRYTIASSNPGPDGVERKADHVVRSRLTTQPFLGLIWKTIFTGMQDVMMNTPH
jgi:hypothetical protein